AGLIPFFAFLGLFLVVPTISVFRRALQHSKGSTVPAMREAITGQFQHYFIESLRVSALSAVIGGLLGALLALVVVQLRRPRWLRTMVTAFSGVSAKMGGVILAFIFIASLGVQGVGTKILGWLPLVGVKLPPDFITSDAGLITVYLYFQIPLMFLVMLPAIDGL